MKQFKFFIGEKKQYPPPINQNRYFREGWDAYFNAEPSDSFPSAGRIDVLSWSQGWLAARQFIRELNEGWLE